jgi:hypothetical protein
MNRAGSSREDDPPVDRKKERAHQMVDPSLFVER